MKQEVSPSSVMAKVFNCDLKISLADVVWDLV